MKDKKRILILGAGYAGVQAAKLLNKKYRKDDNIEITLVDKNPYHTLMTELHEVAGSRTEPDAVQVSLRKIFNKSKVEIVTDIITDVDFKGQKAHSETTTYEYDYLVIGAGSEPAYFGIPGVQENGFTIWSFEDAMKIREHIENMFKKARRERNAAKRREILTFAVAGAGFTGIETVGELVEWKDRLCREYDVDPGEVRLMVIEAMAKILPILNDKLAKKALKFLEKKGVEILTNAAIIEVGKNSVVLKDGTTIPTQTLIWTCGVQGCAFGAKLGLTMGKRGRVQTNDYMQSVDYNNVYIVGDNAYYEENGKPMPQIVEAALQSAETAVHNIIADMEGKQHKAFKSNYHGFMVSIGSHYCVAELAGMSLSGFFAMAMKHLVNLHYLFGIGGFATCWAYIMHEFFDIKDNRSMLGGHIAKKSPTFWIAILRVYVGVLWLLEGVNKIKEGWLTPGNIKIVSVAASSGASQAAGGAAEAVSSASQAAAGAAVQAAANTPVPLLKEVPGFYKVIMDTFVAPHAYLFQVCVVLGEVAIGLALIAGLFTVLASLASIFLCFNFILSAMAGKEILWYIFAGIAMLGGAGRAFGLDYYVMPWLYRWWQRTWYKKKVRVNTGTGNA